MSIVDFLKQQRVIPYYDINSPFDIPLKSYNQVLAQPVAQANDFLSNNPSVGVKIPYTNMGVGNVNYERNLLEDKLSDLQTQSIKDYYASAMPGDRGFGVTEVLNDKDLLDFYNQDMLVQQKDAETLAATQKAQTTTPNTGIFGDDAKMLMMLAQAGGLFGDRKPATKIMQAQATPGLRLNDSNPYVNELRRGIFG